MLASTIHVVLYLLFLVGLPVAVLAEEEVINYSAEQLGSDMVNHKACIKLKGNAVFTFRPSGMVLTADMAYKYDNEDLIEAQGNVKIVDKDGGLVQAELLTYDLKKKEAILAKNVMCASQKAKLYTPKLVYNIETKQGQFLEGGKLLQNQMTLTSSVGLYNGIENTVIFSKEVILVDPSYTLHCDQLCYNTKTEAATFQGLTKIIQEDKALTTEQTGTYLVPKNHLILNQGTLTTKDICLTADCLEFFDTKDCLAIGHVSFQAKAHDAVIVGEQAKYSAKEKKAEITGYPLLTKVVNNETMYLRADTFIALEKTQKEEAPVQEVHALNNVRLYQESLQGAADGAVYTSGDNAIHLHNKPIIWCNNYQITGEEVHLLVEEQEQIKMFVNKDLLMASADPVDNYNQVKGDKMVAHFKGGVIEKMAITGNSESLYFVLGDNNELVGMNHIQCNNMEMTMKDNTLEQVECKPKPIGRFYPAEMLKEEQMQLAGFIWYGDKWPTKENILEVPHDRASSK